MNHSSLITHTFSTEDGIKIVAELNVDKLISLYIQFPGSGNRPIQITPSEIADLAKAASEAANFLSPSQQIG